MTFTLNKPSIKLPSKKVLIISGAIALVLALFVLGMVSQVKADRADRAAAASQAAAQADKEAQAKAHIANLETSVTAEKTKSEAICSWVRGVQAQRRQAVPPLCLPN